MRRGLPLATLDGRLKTAAAVGVSIYAVPLTILGRMVRLEMEVDCGMLE